MTTYYREKQAAERIGVSVRTLQRWRIQGEGPSYCRISARMIAYRDVDLDAYAASRVFKSRAAELAHQVAA